MTQMLEQPTTLPVRAEPKPREIRVVHDESELSYLMDTARYEHTQRIAGGMARASLIPGHLRGNSYEETLANCFLVVNQSLRWGFDPFAVAPETYSIGGKLAYQGKLIAAVINARSNLHGKLRYMFNGKRGDELAVVVFASTKEIPAEAMPLLKRLAHQEDREVLGELETMDVMAVRLSVGQAKTQNQMWAKDPEQKLIYSGAIRWARRHRPEVVLGVITEDDAERIAERQQQEREPQRGVTSVASKLGILPHPADPALTIDPSTSNEAPPDVDVEARAEPEFPPVEDPQIFYEFMGEMAQRDNVADFDAAMNRVNLNHGTNGNGAKHRAAREAVARAALAGKIDWAQGKVMP